MDSQRSLKDIRRMETVTKLDFDSACKLIGKALGKGKIIDFEINHQGSETFQKLCQHIILDPSKSEKESPEFMKTAEMLKSGGITICNNPTYGNLSVDLEGNNIQQSIYYYDEEDIDEDDIDEIHLIEFYMDGILGKDARNLSECTNEIPSSSSTGSSTSEILDRDFENNKECVLPTTEESKKGEATTRIIKGTDPIFQTGQIYSTDEIFDLIVQEDDYPSLLPPEITKDAREIENSSSFPEFLDLENAHSDLDRYIQENLLTGEDSVTAEITNSQLTDEHKNQNLNTKIFEHNREVNKLSPKTFATDCNKTEGAPLPPEIPINEGEALLYTNSSSEVLSHQNTTKLAVALKRGIVVNPSRTSEVHAGEIRNAGTKRTPDTPELVRKKKKTSITDSPAATAKKSGATKTKLTPKSLFKENETHASSANRSPGPDIPLKNILKSREMSNSPKSLFNDKQANSHEKEALDSKCAFVATTGAQDIPREPLKAETASRYETPGATPPKKVKTGISNSSPKITVNDKGINNNNLDDVPVVDHNIYKEATNKYELLVNKDKGVNNHSAEGPICTLSKEELNSMETKLNFTEQHILESIQSIDLEAIKSARKRMARSFVKRKPLLSTCHSFEIVKRYQDFRYLSVVKDEYNRIAEDPSRMITLESKLSRRFNKLLGRNFPHNSQLQNVMEKYGNIIVPNLGTKNAAATLLLIISFCDSVDSLVTFFNNPTEAKEAPANNILTPKMIVVGDPLDKCTVYIFTDNVPILVLENIYEGLIAVYCFYYIFNISYASKVQKLMEYLDFLVGFDQSSFVVDPLK